MRMCCAVHMMVQSTGRALSVRVILAYGPRGALATVVARSRPGWCNAVGAAQQVEQGRARRAAHFM